MDGQLTLLIADNNPQDRRLISDLFPDYWLFETADAGKTVEAAVGKQPDCIVLSLDLPGGFEAFQQLPADPRTVEIPLVALTSAGDDVRERALLAGAADCLLKPLEPRRVKLGVQVALVRGRQLKELRARFERDLYMLIHDLKAPVTVTLGYLGLFERRLRAAAEQAESCVALVEALTRWLRGAKKSGEDLTSLLDDILLLGKAEAGELPLKLQAVDVAALAIEMVQWLEPLALQKQIRLEAGCRRSLVVTTDRRAVGRVLTNLLVNALKFTPSGGLIKVEVVDLKAAVEFAVQDTGPGIPEEEVALVFTKFYSARSSGSGLGLAICRRLVEVLGGRIWVETQLGKGARFVFRLPRAAQENAA